MPGHKVARSSVKNTVLYDKYQCPHCNRLLKDAVQPICGHWLCASCADEVLASQETTCPRPDCQEHLKADQSEEVDESKIRFARKEITDLLTSLNCSHRQQGCPWEGRLEELEKHLNKCQFAPAICPHCRLIMPLHKMGCPKTPVKCPFANFGCNHAQEMTVEELENHVSIHGLEHLEIIAAVLKLFNVQPVAASGGFAAQDSTVGVNNAGDRLLLRQPDVTQPLMKFNAQEIIHEVGSVKLELYGPPQKECAMSDGKDVKSAMVCPSFTRPPDNKHDAGAGYMSLLEQDLHKEQAVNSSLESELKLLKECNRKQREELVVLKEALQTRRDNQILTTEESPSNGTFTWKICDISRMMMEARQGENPTEQSEPFYLYGYKMCLEIQLMGDGIGKNTNVSLFFVIMKGEFDNILSWPFTSKVMFKLINQTGNRDIIDTFQPDPMSSSFQKPKSDMNIASGCPRFASCTELMNERFVTDDTVLMIEFSVAIPPNYE